MNDLSLSLTKPPSSSPMIAIRTSSDHHGLNFGYNGKVFRRKHPVFGIRLNPLSLLFQQPRYYRNNTDKKLKQWLSYFSKKSHVFRCVLYAHASVMARARILPIRPRTTRVFRISVTSAQLINREFLAFSSVNFFKKSPHFLTVAVPLYCPFLVKICKS